MKQITKSPHAVLDYGFDWSRWLGIDTVFSQEILVAPLDAVIIDSNTESGGIVTVWISGGVDNSHAVVTCIITTDQGRIDARSILLKIDDR